MIYKYNIAYDAESDDFHGEVENEAKEIIFEIKSTEAVLEYIEFKLMDNIDDIAGLLIILRKDNKVSNFDSIMFGEVYTS